jgi:hypothetical protein
MINETVKPVLEKHRPSHIVFDLLHYEYKGGASLAVLFLAGYDRERKEVRPICFVARGQTLSWLQSLDRESGLESMSDVTYTQTTEEAAQWLREKSDAFLSA